MRLTALNNFSVNHAIKNQNQNRVQNHIPQKLGTDTVSFGARIPRRSEVDIPKFSEDEMTYSPLFMKYNYVDWDIAGKSESKEGLNLLIQMKKDKKISDEFKKRIIFATNPNSGVFNHILKTNNREDKAINTDMHYSYLEAMLNLAPDKETVMSILCDRFYSNTPTNTLKVVNSKYFYDLAAQIKDLGLLEDVIFKKYDSTPLVSTLSKYKQATLFDLATPKTKERIFSDSSLIFGSADTLSSVLDLADSIDTKLQILRTTNANNDGLLNIPELAPIAIEAIVRIQREILKINDRYQKGRYMNEFLATTKEMLLHVNSNCDLAIRNVQDEELISELLYLSPDYDTLEKQLSRVNLSDDGQSISDSKLLCASQRAARPKQLDVLLNSPVYNTKKGIIAPAAVYLNTEQLVKVLNTFHTSKEMFDFLMKSVTIRHSDGGHETKPLSECYKERQANSYDRFDNMRDGRLWKMLLKAASGRNISAQSALELFERYDFTVPREEEQYYKEIIQSLKEEIAQGQ